VVRGAVPDIVRIDALPEHTDYMDEGCDLSPSCLRCPLTRCKYDRSGGAHALDVEQRDREIVLLRTKYNAPLDLLAATYGISRRSLYRVLRQAGLGRRFRDEQRNAARRQRRAAEAPAHTTTAPTIPSTIATRNRNR
jgi:hypothetical protein